MPTPVEHLEVGYDVPALPGARVDEVLTPALIVDLDAFERNCERLKTYAQAMGVRLRPHAKTHKSAAIAQYQMVHGGACGICCQKLSEAEAFVRAGISDILITNQICDPAKIDRLARLPHLARILVCADDADNIADLSAAAVRHGTTLEVLVEIDCGAHRCGVPPGAAAVDLALQIAAAPNLSFGGLQAYHGGAQHIADPVERRAAISHAVEMTRGTVDLLREADIDCAIVGGAGTGTFGFEGTSGVYNELQCGSYIFMDADYARVQGEDGTVVGNFEHALFVLTSVMSRPDSTRAVCDAGLKAHSVDSGLPVIFGRPELHYAGASDEHGKIDDRKGVLKMNERLRLVPGHCDPTCNLYDWFVGVRDDRVEALWPVTARGKIY